MGELSSADAHETHSLIFEIFFIFSSGDGGYG